MGYKVQPICPDCGKPKARRESKKCWKCYNLARYGVKTTKGVKNYTRQVNLPGVNHELLTDEWMYQFVGLFMGEGAIGIARTNKDTFCCRIYIGLRQDDQDVLIDIQRHLGGYLNLSRRANTTSHPITCWQVSRINDVYEVLKLIKKYTLIPAKKMREVDIAIAYCEWRLMQPYHINDWSPAEKFFHLIRQTREFQCKG